MTNPSPLRSEPSLGVQSDLPARVRASSGEEAVAELADTRRSMRIGLGALILGFGGFLLWAAFVPLDQGVPSVGTVAVETKRKVVQHLQGGIVESVLVREGQWVEYQQPLLRLDAAVTRANYETVRQQRYSLSCVESRLLAEQQGLASIAFDPLLLAAARSDPQLATQMRLQEKLMANRRQSFDAALAVMRESALGYQSIIASSDQVAHNLVLQRDSLLKELTGVRDMVREGYLPVSRQMEMERMLASLASQYAENQSSQTRAQQSILELKQRELVQRADFQKEIEQQLSELRPQLQALNERFKAISDELERIEIRSPAKGQVVGLSVQTIGSVVQPGQRIMDIVPLGEALIVEARIEAHLIDRIRTGAQVDLRFASFANTPQLVVAGTIQSISSDVVADPTASHLPPFYLGRVAVSAEGMRELGHRKLQPGMPVEVIFKTGQRTLLQYIVNPLVKRMASSLKEE